MALAKLGWLHWLQFTVKIFAKNVPDLIHLEAGMCLQNTDSVLIPFFMIAEVKPALRMTDQCKTKLVSWYVGKRSHHDSCRHFGSWGASLAEIRNKSPPFLLGLYIGCWLQGRVGTTFGFFQSDRFSTKTYKCDWMFHKFLKAATNIEVFKLLVKKLVHGCFL